jgi:hypothetical protein
LDREQLHTVTPPTPDQVVTEQGQTAVVKADAAPNV